MQTQYRQAIKRNDIEIVQRIFNDSPDVASILDFENMCKYGNLEMATWFVTRYIIRDKTAALKQACVKGHIDVVKWLVPDCTSLAIQKSIILACKWGHLNVVQYLCDHIMKYSDFIGDIGQTRRTNSTYNDPQYSKQHLFDVACMYNHIDIVQYLLQTYHDGDNASAFITSCKCGNIQTAKYLRDSTHLEDDDMDFALDAAVSNGHIHVADILLNTYTSKYFDIIFVTACSGSLDMVRWLLQRYPDAIENNYVKAFLRASENDRSVILQWLMDNVQSERNDITQITECFKRACQKGHIQIAQMIANKYPVIDICKTDDAFFYQVSSVSVVQWLVNMGLHINANDMFETACQHHDTRLARFLLEKFLEIDIHAKSEAIFLNACRTNNTPIIRMFTEFSDEVASYHMSTKAAARYNHGYVITETRLTDIARYFVEIVHGNFYIYTSRGGNPQCIISEADLHIAQSKMKSAQKI